MTKKSPLTTRAIDRAERALARGETAPAEQLLERAQAAGAVPAHLDPRLPKLPPQLAGWIWRSQDNDVGLVNPPEGWATGFYPFLLAGDAIAEAREIEGRAAAAGAALEADLGPIRKAPPLRLSTTATAVAPFTPGPDAQGVYRRPPDMPERVLVPPRDLVDGRWQPREVYDQAALDELTESIREHGVLEDLIALVNEQGELELITGHRRKRAALAAGGRDVPVKVVEVTAAQADEIAIISNDTRSDLTDIERGKAYEKIIAERGISEAELAKKLSRPRSYIQQRRNLARATPELQQAYAKGQLSFTAVRGICDGSGGDHEIQKLTLTAALKQLKNGGTVTGEGLQRQAQLFIFDRAEHTLKKLGWKSHRVWSGSTPHIYWFAPTAAPAEWSPAEILAACKELRRPPAEQPEIVQLSKEDAKLLSRRGWKYEPNFTPWPAVEREGALVFGAAAIAAAAAARADVAALKERFEAQGWTVAWKYASTWIAATGKGKAKREESCYSYGDALKLIAKIEKGTLGPARASEGHTYAPVCEVCRHKNPKYKHLDGKTVCEGCAPPIEARLAAERAAIGAALAERGVETWIEQAPPWAADLLLTQLRDWREAVLGRGGYIDAEVLEREIQTLTPEQRRQALRALAAELAWTQRRTTTARHMAATAVAAPPTAPRSGANDSPAAAEVRRHLTLARQGEGAHLLNASSALARVPADDPARPGLEAELDAVSVYRSWRDWHARAESSPTGEADPPWTLGVPAIGAYLERMEQRWAAGVVRAEDDADTLTRLGDAVEALAEGAEREALITRLGNLWARLDEGALP